MKNSKCTFLDSNSLQAAKQNFVKTYSSLRNIEIKTSW